MKNIAQNFTSTHALFVLMAAAAVAAAYAIEIISSKLPA